MHLNQLEYFAATMESGSFSAAAKRAYRTPQAIAKAIHNLEQELGGSLFEPAGRSHQPTQLGKSLYEPALEAIAGVNRLHDIARAQAPLPIEGSSATIAVSVASYRCAWFIPASFEPFKREHPNVQLSIKCNSTGACLSALQNNVADAAVTIGPVNDPDLRSRRLFSSSIKAALSPNHPLAAEALEHIPLKLIAHHPVASPLDDTGICCKAIKGAFEEAGAFPHFIDVPIGDEQDFLESGGIILVANRASIAPSAPGAIVKSLAKRDRIVLPICFAEKLGEPNPLLERISSYLALVGERMRKLVP